MTISSVNVAPGTQTMSRSDERYAASMANYAQSKSVFDASPSRQCAAKVGYLSGAAGALGLLVVTPVLASKVTGAMACGISAAASVACCITAGACLGVADEPCLPTDPDREITQLG